MSSSSFRFIEWKIKPDSIEFAIVSDRVTIFNNYNTGRDPLILHIMKKQTLPPISGNESADAFHIRSQPFYSTFLSCDNMCVHIESEWRSQIVIENPVFRIDPIKFNNKSFFLKPIFSLVHDHGIIKYVVKTQYHYYQNDVTFDFLLEYEQIKNEQVPEKSDWSLSAVYYFLDDDSHDLLTKNIDTIREIIYSHILVRMGVVQLKDIMPDYLFPVFKTHYRMFEKTAILHGGAFVI